MSSAALATIRGGQAAFNRGDLAALGEFTTPDVEWGSTGVFPGIAESFTGTEAVQRWAEMVRSEWDEFEVSLGGVLHEAEGLAVVEEQLRGRGRQSGVQVDMSVFTVYWLTEKAIIRRRAAFTTRAAALEAAGLA
jgi:ketosteroid isomerase-like protein